MIWESIPLMTLFDLVIFSLAAASLRIFLIHRGRLVESHMLLPTSLVVTGLFLIGIFYLSDLFIMWVLPLFTAPGVSMAVMEDLHLNYSWINILVITLCIFAGFSLMMQQLLQHSTEVKLLNEDLRTGLKERKQAEEALRDSQKLLLAIVDNSPSVIFLKDMEYRYILFNRSFELALNVKRDDILGKTDYDLYTKKEADRWRKTDQKAIKSGKPVEFMERVPHKDGMHHYLTTKFPLLDREDKPYAVGGIATDVTQLKQTQEALNERLEFETLLSKIFSEFINLPANKIDKEINLCLGLLGEFMKVDRVYISEFSEDQSLLSMEYEWTAKNVQPKRKPFQNLELDSFPWMKERRLRGDTIIIPSIDDLPEEANPEREILAKFDVKSLVSVPMFVGGTVLGSVGFDSTVSARNWSDELIKQLKLVGEIFANAMTRKRSDEALKESEERLKLAIAATQLGIYDWYPLENKVHWDAHMHKLFGLSQRSRKNRNEYFFNIIHPEDSVRVAEMMESFMNPQNEESSFKDEYQVVLKNHVKHIATQGLRFRNEKGIVTRIIGSCLDITERKKTEEGRRKNEQLLEATNLLANVGGWELDLEAMHLAWTAQTCRIHEVPIDYEPDLETAIEFYAPEARPVIQAAVQAGIDHGTPWDLELPFITAKGHRIWVRAQGEVQMKNGRAVRLFGAFQDITERQQAQEKIQKTSEQLRALAAHLQSVREEERTAIAREMHDELGQVLTALKIDLTMMETELQSKQSDPSQQLSEIKRMKGVIDKTIVKVRTLIQELRPEVLDNLDLISALEWQAQEFNTRTDIDYKFNSKVKDINVPEETATAVFRIFQETLTNIARHSKATYFEVNISKKNRHLFLKIADNGVGIPANKIENSKTFGLLGMKERALILGGKVEIRGNSGRGTIVTARIPI